MGSKEIDQGRKQKEKIKLPKSVRRHISDLKAQGRKEEAFQFREEALKRKREQKLKLRKELEKLNLRREVEELEKRVKEEEVPDPFKLAEVEFTIPWLKNKLGDITNNERKESIKSILTQLEPDVFSKFVREKNGSGKTKVREIIDRMIPSKEEMWREFTELEVKLMVKERFPPEEAIETEFTFVWLGEKLELFTPEERRDKISDLYEEYSPDVTKEFIKEKAKNIVDRIMPSVGKR